MRKAYVDGLYFDDDYRREKRGLEEKLAGLVFPEADAAEEAGNLIQQLPELWAGGSLGERRQLLLTMLDAIYVDSKEDRAIVVLKPKPAFRAVFQIATTREGSVWSSTMKILRKLLQARRMGLRVSGGDGG